jgi:sugar phosphate isomerase/epimerase
MFGAFIDQRTPAMLNRRRFLACSSVAAIGVLAGPAAAIDRVVRNGTPKFKFSLAAYSYRSLLQGSQGKEPQLTLKDFIRDLRRHAFLLGLDISGTAIGNEFGHPKGEKRDAEIAKTKQWIDHAEIMGAPVIRIFAGHTQRGQTDDEAHALMVSAIEECCDYAGKHGVHLALENHGGPTATADGLLRFVRDIKSPWFGVNLDGGNFRGDDPYAELARIAPYTINAQIKAKVGGKPADFKRLAKIMRDANYRGYIVLEYEEPGNVREQCARYINEMREAFA